MFNLDFHTIFVALVMLVFPVIFTLIEFLRKKNNFFNILLKWVIFWTIGVRALTGGIMQFANPKYTMGLLSLGINSEIIIRELGFLQFGVGLTAILSIVKKTYIEPVFISFGIFMAGASYLHIIRFSQIDFGELVSLIGDLLIVAVILVYFLKRLFTKNRVKTEA